MGLKAMQQTFTFTKWIGLHNQPHILSTSPPIMMTIPSVCHSIQMAVNYTLEVRTKMSLFTTHQHGRFFTSSSLVAMMSTTLSPVQMDDLLQSHMPKKCQSIGPQMVHNCSISTITPMLYWDWIGVLMDAGSSPVEMTTASGFTTLRMEP